MGLVLPFSHVRSLGDAARDAKTSAVIPFDFACSVASSGTHQEAGMRPRPYHLRAAKTGAPMSRAMASAEGQHCSTSSRKDPGLIPKTIRHPVLKSKPNLSNAHIQQILYYCPMDKPKDSDHAYLEDFLVRVFSARENAGLTQAEMAHILATSQTNYSKYEVRTLLPHRYIWTFCLTCKISVEWLMTGQGRGATLLARPKPEKRRGRKSRRRIAA